MNQDTYKMIYVHHGLHALSSIPHNTEDEFVKALRYSSNLTSAGCLLYNEDKCPDECDDLESVNRPPFSMLFVNIL